MSKNNNVTKNNEVSEKEEKNMTNAYDDEMDLRSDEQKDIEESEGTQVAETKEDKEELNFYQKHKVAIWIGAGVVGVAGLGLGFWGVHNIGMGKTFFGAPKFHGHRHGHHGYNNYKVNQMPQQYQQATVPTQQVDIPATEQEPAKVVDFAEGAAKVVDTAKKVSDLKVNSL